MHAVALIPPRAGATAEAETMRLAAQVRDLAADREQLNARIAMLERNLEDMTGSIKLQSEQLAAARAAAANTPQLEPSAPATTPAFFAPATPPASALPAIMPPAMPLGSVLPTLAPLAMPALKVTAASWPATKPEAEKPAAQANAADSETEPAPLPPVRVATAPANEPAAEPPEPAKDEFGIDLGGAAASKPAHPLGGVEGQLRAAAGGAAPGRYAAPEAPGRRHLSLGGGAAAGRRRGGASLRPLPGHAEPAATRPSSSARNWPRIDCRRAGAPA